MIIKMADLVIDMRIKKAYTADMCQAYIYTGPRPVDFAVESTRELMIREYQENPGYALDYLESLCIYRQICEKILDYDGMLLHAAAVAVDGQAYLFSALSGTGKTTHMRLWLEKFGDRAAVVNGDKPLLRKLDGVFHACGTPWSGKEALNTNMTAPIRGICILERAQQNWIKKITPQEGLHTMLTQTMRPKNASGMQKMLGILDDLLRTVPLYRLGCNMEPEAAEVAYNGMQ